MVEIVNRAYFYRTFLATNVLQLSQIYRLIRKKGSQKLFVLFKVCQIVVVWRIRVNEICEKFRVTGSGI